MERSTTSNNNNGIIIPSRSPLEVETHDTVTTTTPYQNMSPQSRHNDDNAEEGGSLGNLSLGELLYSTASYHAMVTPVCITMILAAMAVVFINTAQTLEQGERQFAQAYTVLKTSDDSGTGKNLAFSLVNTFIMVCAICLMTFGIVILYKFRMMACLIGYMMFSSTALLGVLGGSMCRVALDKYRIPIDTITFHWGLYNFAFVGVVSIFYKIGIPSNITQLYLVLTSVILAWQLSHFDVWTTWCLLVMLALYDLCAVLTPWGPLKALVNLMSQKDSPDMPGLLYEAQLPPGTQRPGRPSNDPPPPASPTSPASSEGTPYHAYSEGDDEDEEEEERTSQPVQHLEPLNTVLIPLAICMIYKLPILDHQAQQQATTSASTPLQPQVQYTSTSHLDATHSPQELCQLVEAVMPRNGGKIEVSRDEDGAPQYRVLGRHGELKRLLSVDEEGKVFQEFDDDDESEDGSGGTTIRLGLGDFIFYSVLVAKAAQYSFTSFAACMLSILAGLGSTLILLAVYKHALPALPISIFLAVIMYLMTRVASQPWIHMVLQSPYYV